MTVNLYAISDIEYLENFVGTANGHIYLLSADGEYVNLKTTPNIWWTMYKMLSNHEDIRIRLSDTMDSFRFLHHIMGAA